MKRKIYLVVSLIAAILVLSVAATAAIMIPANERAKENSKALENSPVIDDDWTLPDCGKPVCSKEFIHYIGKPAKAPKAPLCYKLLGIKWKSLPVNYVINPSNPQNLSDVFVTSAISTSAETWDAATSSELFNDAYTVDSNAQYGTQDFQNAIVFGNYPDSNVIAVTTIWWTPVGRKLVEFDIMFDIDWRWGNATVDATKMDLQNIATHELGHGAGLDDIYDSACSEVTMYGYSGYGETKKRTLEQPDITGLQRMYGV